MIWFSILGALPFTLALPYADLFWANVLVVLIGLIISSAFSAIVVMAQELVPGGRHDRGSLLRIRLRHGRDRAALLGVLADDTSIQYVFHLCAYLPLIGMLTVFLPNMKAGRKAA